MANRKNPFFLIKTGILFIFIILQLYLIFINKHQTLALEVYPNTNPSPAVCYENTVGQTFVPRRGNISRIEIMLGTFGRENDRDIVFSLWELTPEKRMLTETIFNASSVKNNLFHAVDFSPVAVSRDRAYAFELRSPQSTPDNSICVWMNREDIYDQGAFIYNNQEATGDLVFRVYSKRPIFKELSRVTRNYSGIFAGQVFLMAAVLLFVLIQILVLIKLLNYLESWLQKQGRAE
jgi:hypothetical protein